MAQDEGQPELQVTYNMENVAHWRGLPRHRAWRGVRGLAVPPQVHGIDVKVGLQCSDLHAQSVSASKLHARAPDAAVALTRCDCRSRGVRTNSM